MTTMNRREVCGGLAALGACAALGAAPAPGTGMATRSFGTGARSGSVPVIGMGSSGTFDAGGDAGARAPLREVLRRFVAGGGRVLDTSPMYGRAEQVLGDLIAELAIRPQLWIATKVWTRGRAEGERQVAESLRRLGTDRLELLQVHNLLDWREHVPTLRALQESGRIRYTGITHYRADAHAAVEEVLRQERFDWLQINYSLGEREAEARLLPFCQERGIAVMANRPFQDGALFARVRDRPLPPWAAEVGCASWGQFLLRYVVSHPAVTCTIPATARPAHVADNVAAGLAPLPDERQRALMAEYFAAL